MGDGVGAFDLGSREWTLRTLNSTARRLIKVLDGS